MNHLQVCNTNRFILKNIHVIWLDFSFPHDFMSHCMILYLNEQNVKTNMFTFEKVTYNEIKDVISPLKNKKTCDEVLVTSILKNGDQGRFETFNQYLSITCIYTNFENYMVIQITRHFETNNIFSECEFCFQGAQKHSTSRPAIGSLCKRGF